MCLCRLTHRVIQVQVRVKFSDQMVTLVQFIDLSGKPVNCGEREGGKTDWKWKMDMGLNGEVCKEVTLRQLPFIYQILISNIL